MWLRRPILASAGWVGGLTSFSGPLFPREGETAYLLNHYEAGRILLSLAISGIQYQGCARAASCVEPYLVAETGKPGSRRVSSTCAILLRIALRGQEDYAMIVLKFIQNALRCQFLR